MSQLDHHASQLYKDLEDRMQEATGQGVAQLIGTRWVFRQVPKVKNTPVAVIVTRGGTTDSSNSCRHHHLEQLLLLEATPAIPPCLHLPRLKNKRKKFERENKIRGKKWGNEALMSIGCQLVKGFQQPTSACQASISNHHPQPIEPPLGFP